MTKRDLKADLALVRQSGFYSSIGGVWKIAEHAIERAIEAEALSRELVEALEIAYDAMYLDIMNAHDYPNCELKVKKVLAKAKEVLGDV